MFVKSSANNYLSPTLPFVLFFMRSLTFSENISFANCELKLISRKFSEFGNNFFMGKIIKWRVKEIMSSSERHLKTEHWTLNIPIISYQFECLQTIDIISKNNWKTRLNNNGKWKCLIFKPFKIKKIEKLFTFIVHTSWSHGYKPSGYECKSFIIYPVLPISPSNCFR